MFMISDSILPKRTKHNCSLMIRRQRLFATNHHLYLEKGKIRLENGKMRIFKQKESVGGYLKERSSLNTDN